MTDERTVEDWDEDEDISGTFAEERPDLKRDEEEDE
jgi:hypothetical protein